MILLLQMVPMHRAVMLSSVFECRRIEHKATHAGKVRVLVGSLLVNQQCSEIRCL